MSVRQELEQNMVERIKFPPVNPERVRPGKRVLVGEPILRRPEDDKDLNIFQIPKGSEMWAQAIGRMDLSEEDEIHLLGDEYLSIVQALKFNGVDFRFIVAHPDLVDTRLILGMHDVLEMKGAGFFPQVPPQFTCFPRDLLLDLDDKVAVNPQANLRTIKETWQLSLLGEGGAILKLDRKMFVINPRAYRRGGRRKNYRGEIKTLAEDYLIGFLPPPFGVEINIKKNTKEEFPSNHLDRVAAFIKGRDSQDYLLVDPFYFYESKLPWGKYRPKIEESCERLGVYLIAVEKKRDDVPYGLNLVQFDDGSVFLSSGHQSLEKLLGGIVGSDKVFTTNRPIVYFPVLRRGGIRCMILMAPRMMFSRLTSEEEAEAFFTPRRRH